MINIEVELSEEEAKELLLVLRRVWWHDVVFPEGTEGERREATKRFGHASEKVCAAILKAGVDLAYKGG
jgi:hypothetical protein